MPVQRPLVIGVFAVLLLALAAARTMSATPQATAANDVTAALLGEVHELRLAMERATAVGPRVQLTLARLNIEEQRTMVLSGQLDQVRQEQARAALETVKLSTDLEDVQRALQTVTDPSQRRGHQFEEQALKRKLSQQATIEEGLRAREREAAQLLTTEQSHWVDLNAKLDELERLLGPVREPR